MVEGEFGTDLSSDFGCEEGQLELRDILDKCRITQNGALTVGKLFMKETRQDFCYSSADGAGHFVIGRESRWKRIKKSPYFHGFNDNLSSRIAVALSSGLCWVRHRLCLVSVQDIQS